MRLDWSSPRSFASAEVREIRPGGPGRHRRGPPGWWRARRRTASLSQPCGRVRHYCEKRREAGIAAVAIRISHHFAALCPDIEPFAAEGFIALAMVNGRQRMVVWGGNRKLLGTSPMAFACPRPAGCRWLRTGRRASWLWARFCLPAPRSLLAVSCPVSEYDRSPGMIGEKAARMILAAATQTLRHRILGGGNRWHRHHSKAPARTPMSRSSR